MNTKNVIFASLLISLAGATANAQGLTTVGRAYPAEETKGNTASPLPFAPPPGSFKATANPAPTFDVTKSDKTVRETLARWAKAAGWTHEMVHWTLDRDHPIEGLADASQFGGDFRSAVRTLLSSTENTDRPAQPCFYSNFVVRVIAKAELCDRSGTQQ